MNYYFPGFCAIPHLETLLQLNVFLVTQNLGIMTCNIYVRLDHIALQAGIVVVEKAEGILRPSLALKLKAILNKTVLSLKLSRQKQSNKLLGTYYG